MVNTIKQPTHVGRPYWTLTLLALSAASLILGVVLHFTIQSVAPWVIAPAILGPVAVQLLPGVRAQPGVDRFLWTVLAAILTAVATGLWLAAIVFTFLMAVCAGQDCF